MIKNLSPGKKAWLVTSKNLTIKQVEIINEDPEWDTSWFTRGFFEEDTPAEKEQWAAWVVRDEEGTYSVVVADSMYRTQKQALKSKKSTLSTHLKSSDRRESSKKKIRQWAAKELKKVEKELAKT